MTMPNTGEITKPSQDTAPKDTVPETKSESTPEKETRTRTETEYRQAIEKTKSDSLAEAMRRYKSQLTAIERKAQEKAEQGLADIREENKQLQSTLDELGKDDEDHTRLTKLLRDNKAKERTLLDREENLKKEWEPRIAAVRERELAHECQAIAAEYEGADAKKLERLTGKLQLPESMEDWPDFIREIAADFWTPKTTQKEEPRKVDSGVTTGRISGKTPSLEELRTTDSKVAKQKVDSGEWVLPYGIRL